MEAFSPSYFPKSSGKSNRNGDGGFYHAKSLTGLTPPSHLQNGSAKSPYFGEEENEIPHHINLSSPVEERSANQRLSGQTQAQSQYNINSNESTDNHMACIEGMHYACKILLVLLEYRTSYMKVRNGVMYIFFLLVLLISAFFRASWSCL